MKRVNIRESFSGEPSPGQEFLERSLGALGTASRDDEGSEALLLAVRGGELTIVIPSGLPDKRAVEEAETIRGVLHLENERVVTFEIQAGATGAFYDDEPADFHRRLSVSGGLSGISSGHDYMATTAPRSAATDALVARDIMTADPVTAKPSHTVQEAAGRLAYPRISGRPWLAGRGKLTGFASAADRIARRGRTGKPVMTRDPGPAFWGRTREHAR